MPEAKKPRKGVLAAALDAGKLDRETLDAIAKSASRAFSGLSPSSPMLEGLLESARAIRPIDFSLGESNDALRRHMEFEAREKAEQREREVTMVRTLLSILGELQKEREERKVLEAQVQEHERLLQRYRTGAPGRPGSSHLVLEEFESRRQAGDVEKTLAEQARKLAAWLRSEHPHAHPMKPRAIENALRPFFWDAQKKL